MRHCPQCQSLLVSSNQFAVDCDAYCLSCKQGWITLERQNEYWTPREVRFEMWRACPAFCPDCLSVPLDEGYVESSSAYLKSQDVLQCSQCLGVYLSHLDLPGHEPDPNVGSQVSVPEDEPSPSDSPPPLSYVPDLPTPSPVPESPSPLKPNLTPIQETPKPLPPLNRQKRDLNPLPDSKLSTKELIWLGALMACIIFSLLYWMSP